MASEEPSAVGLHDDDLAGPVAHFKLAYRLRDSPRASFGIPCAWDSKHDDPRMAPGWKAESIREVQICRQKDELFLNGSLENERIGLPPEADVTNVGGLVS